MTTTDYDQFLERQRERQRLWIASVTRQAVARRDTTPEPPPPPKAPAADAPPREWLNFWRLKTSGDFFAGYLFAAINKMLDANEALAARVEQLEARLAEAAPA